MSNFFIETNWLLILSLVFGSAALAVLGDMVGSKYGKKRISVFKLRPKHTSRLITALTGALIAVGILGVMSAFSQDVRTALFGMKMLKQQLYDLQFQLTQSEENTTQMRVSLAEASASLDLTGFELDTMRNEKIILEQEKRELETSLLIMREELQQIRHDLQALRSESIALNANVLLGQRIFEPGMTREEIIRGLNALKQTVRLNVLAKISDQAFTRLRDVPIDFDAETETALIDELASSDVRQYVRALSGENYTFGENLRIMVRLETGMSVLTYKSGEPVYRKFFMNDREETKTTAEGLLHIFLRELRNKAVSDGILPDPATNNVGTLEGEAFFNAVEELNQITQPVIITALEGPVVIDLIFEE